MGEGEVGRWWLGRCVDIGRGVKNVGRLVWSVGKRVRMEVVGYLY